MNGCLAKEVAKTASGVYVIKLNENAKWSDGSSVTSKDIKYTIENQRKSVSGVDRNEEGSDLVKFENLYGLASKVISVLNEVYKKLIEQTGV